MKTQSETIGGITFAAIRHDKPCKHWRYSVNGQVGHQGYESRPKMFEDLRRAYALRPDRWLSDWQKFSLA